MADTLANQNTVTLQYDGTISRRYPTIEALGTRAFVPGSVAADVPADVAALLVTLNVGFSIPTIDSDGAES